MNLRHLAKQLADESESTITTKASSDTGITLNIKLSEKAILTLLGLCLGSTFLIGQSYAERPGATEIQQQEQISCPTPAQSSDNMDYDSVLRMDKQFVI
jgi:hypothetical protein